MSDWLPILLLLLAALVFWLLSRRQRKRSGLPQGEVVYADHDQWQKLPKPLFDADLRLVGKPDYVVRQKDSSLMPVELKSGMAPSQPYESHLLQLYAYALLLERTQGSRPSKGVVAYQDRQFEVMFDSAAEEHLMGTLNEMRQAERLSGGPDRSHRSAQRCRACGYREICDQSLV